jgi:hypothetical protein
MIAPGRFLLSLTATSAASPWGGVEEHRGVFLDPEGDASTVEDLGGEHDAFG